MCVSCVSSNICIIKSSGRFFVSEFFKKLTKWAEKFGDIFLIWVGQRPFIFLYRVEAVQPLLSNSNYIDKSLEYQYLKPWLGTGLVTSSGKWLKKKKKKAQNHITTTNKDQ